MYSATRFSSLKLDAGPSLLFSNLCANAEVIAFAHAGTVHALADVGRRSASFKLPLGAGGEALAPPGALAPPPSPGSSALSAAPDSVTHVGVVALEAGRLLVACTPTAFCAYPCSDFSEQAARAPRALYTRALADCGAAVLGARRAEDHFFRGSAGLAQQNLLLVGTSWGDVLAWRLEGAVLSLAQVLSGGHSAAITCIAADDRCVCCARAARRAPGPALPALTLLLTLLSLPPYPPACHTWAAQIHSEWG